MATQGQDSPEENKRTARRLRVLKQGKILLANNLSILDCTVRDVSPTGARLICSDPGAIPNDFRLVLTADRTMRDVKVMWRRPEQVGVVFTSEPRRAPLLRW
ncbi:PilZ domain-containing protein [Aestuariivirga sp.]|uniref:PilZ domain-containing protein n=1 Tax=Aestuariivirga sp. TaxID=2650926 RepID=UPI003593F301